MTSTAVRLVGAALLVVVAACRTGGGTSEASMTVRVLAAASLTDVVTDLGEAFEEDRPGTTVELHTGPSPALALQVVEGAPADVLITASTATMEPAVAGGAVSGRPIALATNRLALVVPAGDPGGVDGLDDLADPDLVVGLCAVGVPCGDLARRALDAAGIVPSVDTEEVDVRALLSKVADREVDVGVVYRTDAAAAGDRVEEVASPDLDGVVTTYPIARLARAADPDAADAFVAFARSGEGRAVLTAAGFGPPP